MKRRGSVFWLFWTVALLGTSGCGFMDNWSKQQKTYTLTGAVVGGLLGAGAGAYVGGEEWGEDEDGGVENNDERAAGAAIGAAAGALIGGAIGYLLAEGPTPPPPPPPPAAPPPPPPPPPPPAPAKIILRGINFDFDKSNIKSEFIPVLEEAVRILQENASIRVRIEGHTDSVGTDAYNQRLSERRANAVRAFLTSRGVDAGRLETAGYGESQPIAPNTTPDGADNPEGRAVNRRAELQVIE